MQPDSARAGMTFHTHKFEAVALDPDSFRFRRGLLHNLEADAKARCIWYFGGLSARRLLRTAFYDGSLAGLLLRLGEACGRHAATCVFSAVVLRLLRMLCHVTVGRGASFGPGLVLLHPFGMFIHKTVRAGVNLVLENSVTLGGEDDLGPELGDNVFVGVGARVIGPIRLGDRCRIGANAVVMVPVNDDHVAAGNPARQIPITRP